MKHPFELREKIENKLEDYILAKKNNTHIKNYLDYCERTAKTYDVFKYAEILYPKFVLVEDMVVLESHYTENNWNKWRKIKNAQDTANLINHVHLDDYLSSDYPIKYEIEDELGELLVLFWQIAVGRQFPNKNISVEYDGNTIDILNL